MMDAPSSPTQRSADTLQQSALEDGFVAGEAWAFEAAYTAYRRSLYGAAYAVLRDAGDAEDCVHDVLVRLWQRGHAYTRARGALHAFLVVCVRNEALTRLRRSSNRSRIEREKLEPPGSQPGIDESVPTRVDVQHSLQSLTPAQREAIQMAYFEGLTHEQIAQRLHQPVGTVKSRLSNALRGLRVALRGEPQ
jgi:RNA polymerase sigma-70 factor (ECF subfamily)